MNILASHAFEKGEGIPSNHAIKVVFVYFLFGMNCEDWSFITSLIFVLNIKTCKMLTCKWYNRHTENNGNGWPCTDKINFSNNNKKETNGLYAKKSSQTHFEIHRVMMMVVQMHASSGIYLTKVFKNKYKESSRLWWQ